MLLGRNTDAREDHFPMQILLGWCNTAIKCHFSRKENIYWVIGIGIGIVCPLGKSKMFDLVAPEIYIFALKCTIGRLPPSAGTMTFAGPGMTTVDEHLLSLPLLVESMLPLHWTSIILR